MAHSFLSAYHPVCPSFGFMHGFYRKVHVAACSAYALSLLKRKMFPAFQAGPIWTSASVRCHCGILPFPGVWEEAWYGTGSHWLSAVLCEVPGEGNVILGILKGKPMLRWMGGGERS